MRRGQALLAYLASKETRRENREVLLDLLWPDRFKEQAQASLRQVVFELKALAPQDMPFLITSRNEVALGPAIKECDLWSFEERIAANQIEDAEFLLGLYAGPFLDGPPLATEPFQQWTAIQRSRLENLLETSILNATQKVPAPPAWKEVFGSSQNPSNSAPCVSRPCGGSWNSPPPVATRQPPSDITSISPGA